MNVEITRTGNGEFSITNQEGTLVGQVFNGSLGKSGNDVNMYGVLIYPCASNVTYGSHKVIPCEGNNLIWVGTLAQAKRAARFIFHKS